LRCGFWLHYSVDLWIGPTNVQSTEPVPFKNRKLALNIRIFFTVYLPEELMIRAATARVLTLLVNVVNIVSESAFPVVNYTQHV